jgi:hypothetical protein
MTAASRKKRNVPIQAPAAEHPVGTAKSNLATALGQFGLRCLTPLAAAFHRGPASIALTASMA